MPAGATDRDRTGTPLRTSDFKSEAATYYATVALFGLGRKNRTSASCSQSTGDTISLYRVNLVAEAGLEPAILGL